MTTKASTLASYAEVSILAGVKGAGLYGAPAQPNRSTTELIDSNADLTNDIDMFISKFLFLLK
jgi:hypothetical protein